MNISIRRGGLFGLVAFGLLLAGPAAAQIEDNLSAYAGDNAEGYLKPLVDAFGADLNDGLFHSAYIPQNGFRASFELKVMSVQFGDDDRTFSASTPDEFVQSGGADETYDAPTIVGDTDALTVDGQGGTSYSFPGGLDMESFALAVPQLRVGTVAGTEALIRWFALDTGDAEIGDISLFGLGARHSVSQYMGDEPPLDLAVGFMWQKFNVGENSAAGELISSKAFSLHVHGSKQINMLVPYAGLAIDNFEMDVQYDDDPGSGENLIDLAFESDTAMHLTLGCGVHLPYLAAFAEYNVAGQNSIGFGVSIGSN